MQQLNKPTVLISACLGFENCRYNGEVFHDEFLEKLQHHVRFVPICPETSIGLGIPREVIRIVKSQDTLKLIQPKTGLDLTEKLHSFSKQYLKELPPIEGIILKSKSPTCGYKDAKHYSSMEKGASSSKGNGLFAQALLEHYPGLPMTSDGQLMDYKYREHFLIKLFLVSALHLILQSGTFEELKNFHENNRLLLYCYSQKGWMQLDRLIKSKPDIPFRELSSIYLTQLFTMTSRVARYTSNAKVLRHAAESISDTLTLTEKDFLHDALLKYEKGYVPFGVPLYIIKSYAAVHRLESILAQSLFTPFPEDLLELRDSGKARI